MSKEKPSKKAPARRRAIDQPRAEEASGEVSVVALTMDEAHRGLVAEMAKYLQSEEQVVAFLLDLRPIRGSWELVEMARHIGQDIEAFWTIGVLEWLGRDEDGERLAELHRVFRNQKTS